jgi:HIRAN domain
MSSNEAKLSIIDLLDDSDGDDELLKDSKPIFAKRKRSPDTVTAVNFFPSTVASSTSIAPSLTPSASVAPVAALSSSVASVASSASLEDRKPAATEHREHLAFLGSFECSIVGAQHYPGQAHRGDSMTLERDPGHTYNRNAIQVVGEGSKRGHLPLDQAAILAPMLDTMSHNVTFKATILNAGDGYKIPMAVDVYAKSFRALSADEIKGITNVVDLTLQKVGWRSDSEPTTAEVLRAHENEAEQSLHALNHAVAMGVATSQALTFEDFVPADVDMSEMEASQQDELDRMFDEIQAEQLANLPDIAMPKQFDAMDLYDYQKNGIRWLYNQEKQDDAPPFFKKNGNGKWYCNITNCQQRRTPLPIRGACLADDMGLGKVRGIHVRKRMRVGRHALHT